MANERYRHIFLTAAPPATPFSNPRHGGGAPRIRERDRFQHGAYLRERLENAWKEVEQRQAVAVVERHGSYIDFISDPGHDLILKSLEDLRSGIRLLNVRRLGDEGNQTIIATIYVPHTKRGFFLRKITKYIEEEDRRSHKPKNQKLINSIADIRKSVLESFWQDDLNLLPKKDSLWIEVWLSSSSEDTISRFNAVVQQNNISQAEGTLKFPERAIKMIHANRDQLETLIENSDEIAEMRCAKEVASYFVELSNIDQLDKVQSLLRRTVFDDETRISVCILDTGINNGHLLISQVLSNSDQHALDPAWGLHDHNGHGTMMAGLVIYGDLLKVLQSQLPVSVFHKLESVKILPPSSIQNDPKFWGYLTSQCISRAKIQSPERQRIVCLAITSKDFRDQGRPSSWSAQIDELSSNPDSEYKQLIILCAGNIDDSAEWQNYFASNQTNEIHDPGQAWNALTIGAFTEKVTISDPTMQGWTPVAPFGGLSPFSTTSLSWGNKWPIKPEVLFEGGNVASGPNKSILDSDDLALLSTFFKPNIAQFVPFSMTSAAAAQASWMAARILKEYPTAWPETIRALIVHSAEWTDTMKSQFLHGTSRNSYRSLVRVCGYGVPKLDRALFCAANSLTLISQAVLQPYDKNSDGRLITREMHLYALPWPRLELSQLHDTIVQMRITLSYFIEPGPGEIGWQDRYRYPSYALRFSVKGPAETPVEFERRINLKAREEGSHPGTSGPSDKWIIGENTRDVGSIHSDIWEGSAADLAESNIIAVYPTVGWWRERAYLGKWNKNCRYSLIVSIHTPVESVDIYTPVAIQIGIVTPIQVRTS